MRYHYEKPENYSSLYGLIHTCYHTAYNIGDKRLAVIQQRYDEETKSTFWTEIDPWLTDILYSNDGFKSFFDDRAG